MNRMDWNLMALAAGEGLPLSPVQFQKSLFLFEQNYPHVFSDSVYGFEPFDYGPFSAAVYSDAERLAKLGLASISTAPGGWTQYAATPEGLRRAQDLLHHAPVEPTDYLIQAVRWTRSLTFQQLVLAIYERFPNYKEKSVFRH